MRQNYDDSVRIHMPKWLDQAISRSVWRSLAAELYEWLQGNSNTVIVDDMLNALRRRRDWKQIEKDP